MVVLASGSPRRKELLSQLLTDFITDPATGAERADGALSPEKTACALAENKCEEVFLRHTGDIVIGCDTIVVYGARILGKPKDKQDAVNTLKMLSGKVHHVITGVCIKYKNKKLINYDKTEVSFNILSAQFIEEYVNGGSPMDKAGSYGIQDGGIVAGYKGSYSNVVGLPVTLVKNMLEEITKDI